MSKIRVDRFTPRDLADTPEGFEKRYADRKPRPKERSPLEEPKRPGSMKEMLARFNIDERA
jgi:hypothetical protein